MLKAVRQHTDCRWVLLYIERWLKAPVQMEDGSLVARTAGTPQGGVISPLLANLFLHYAFDMWMAREFPHIPFERYADDAICHCRSAEEARVLWSALGERLAACKLVLHPVKTKIVYCKDTNRRGDFPVIAFDFLGFQFRPGDEVAERREAHLHARLHARRQPEVRPWVKPSRAMSGCPATRHRKRTPEPPARRWPDEGTFAYFAGSAPARETATRRSVRASGSVLPEVSTVASAFA